METVFITVRENHVIRSHYAFTIDATTSLHELKVLILEAINDSRYDARSCAFSLTRQYDPDHDALGDDNFVRDVKDYLNSDSGFTRTYTHMPDREEIEYNPDLYLYLDLSYIEMPEVCKRSLPA